MKKQRILIVEDDCDMSKLISYHLEDSGMHIDTEENGRRGLERALQCDYVLVILDLVLPELGGLEICRALRVQKREVGILMLTKKSAEIERVLGLEMGADDYLTKPFSVLELVARVKALIRRLEAIPPLISRNMDSMLIRGELSLDRRKRRAFRNNEEIMLTTLEFDLLSHMAEQPGRVFTRAQLLQAVWGYDNSVYEHTVSSHVNRLRSKLRDDTAHPRYISTVWGYGYRFLEQPHDTVREGIN